jgi:hypothetical protein
MATERNEVRAEPPNRHPTVVQRHRDAEVGRRSRKPGYSQPASRIWACIHRPPVLGPWAVPIDVRRGEVPSPLDARIR